MSQPGYPPSSGAGERWAVNMPAVIGVVFVFLVGVIVWVINSSGDGDDSLAVDGGSTTTLPAGALVTTTLPGATTTVSTTPGPMPSSAPGDSAPAGTAPPATTVAATSPPTETTAAPATTTPATTTPVTTPATAAPTTAVADRDGPDGDLGIDGVEIRRPRCDDSYITIIASAIGGQASAGSIESVLDSYPGSNYLRTDATCPSLNPSIDGQPIYVVYFGPYDDDGEACAARSQGPSDAYVRRLSNSLGPDHSVSCA
jgi:hypothetical protein